jgi:hypothetical protein
MKHGSMETWKHEHGNMKAYETWAYEEQIKHET